MEHFKSDSTVPFSRLIVVLALVGTVGCSATNRAPATPGEKLSAVSDVTVKNRDQATKAFEELEEREQKLAKAEEEFDEARQARDDAQRERDAAHRDLERAQERRRVSEIELEQHATDVALQEILEGRLAEKKLGSGVVKASVLEGAVRLDGQVADAKTAKRVEDAVRSIPGVRSLDSRLSVTPR